MITCAMPPCHTITALILDLRYPSLFCFGFFGKGAAIDYIKFFSIQSLHLKKDV